MMGIGDKCIVRGPFAKPRNIEGETTLTAGTNELANIEKSVVCQGLKKAELIGAQFEDKS